MNSMNSEMRSCANSTFLFFRILMFEEKKKEKQKPKGPPPKRDIASLPWKNSDCFQYAKFLRNVCLWRMDPGTRSYIINNGVASETKV